MLRLLAPFALFILSPLAYAENDYQLRAMTTTHTAGGQTGPGTQIIVVHKDLLDAPCVFAWGDFRYQWTVGQDENFKTKGWLATGPGGYADQDGFVVGWDLRGGYSPSDWFHLMSIGQWYPFDQSGYFYLAADTKLPAGLGRVGFETEDLGSYQNDGSLSLGIGPTWTLPFARPIFQLSWQFRPDEDNVARMLVIVPF